MTVKYDEVLKEKELLMKENHSFQKLQVYYDRKLTEAKVKASNNFYLLTDIKSNLQFHLWLLFVWYFFSPAFV